MFRYGGNNQYALGIKVPSKYCKQVTALDQNFLPDNDPQQVKCISLLVLKEFTKVPVWSAPNQNQSLEHQTTTTPSTCCWFILSPKHLLPLTHSCKTSWVQIPMAAQDFSPWILPVWTPGGTYSIIPAFTMFRNPDVHQKAFVFNQVWDHNVDNPKWRENILAINAYIPVYRCDAGGCTRCVKNQQVNQKCLQN